MAETPNHVLLHHGFDRGVEEPTFFFSEGGGVLSEGGMEILEEGISGPSLFLPGGGDGELTISLPENAANATDAGWTLSAFWRQPEKASMTRIDNAVLEILDREGNPMARLGLDGFLKVFPVAGSKESVGGAPLDALYWLPGEGIHFAFVYDPAGSRLPGINGRFTAYWQGKPFFGQNVDFGERRPAAFRVVANDLPLEFDELRFFAGALNRRALVELTRNPGLSEAGIDSLLKVAADFSAGSAFEKRQRAWRDAAGSGRLISFPEDPSAKEKNDVPGAGGVFENKFSRLTKDRPVVLEFDSPEENRAALAVRYSLARKIDLMWPLSNPGARGFWIDNFVPVEVFLNGESLGEVRLFPTGEGDSHTGDIDPWAWGVIAEGHEQKILRGKNVLEIRRAGDLLARANPSLDALLLLPEDAIPAAPEFPRWVDSYRIPPVWWVEGMTSEVKDGERIDTFQISLRNRNDEPYRAALTLNSDRLQSGQTAMADVATVDLPPGGSQELSIAVRTPEGAEDLSGFVRVNLWEEDSGSHMEYRLWHHRPREGWAGQPHPRLFPAPDKNRQQAFRAWLESREEKLLTPELLAWAAGPGKEDASPSRSILEYRLKTFPQPLLGERLEILDMWMEMTPEQLASYLPRGPAEDPKYGTGWVKVGEQLSGHWAGETFDYEMTPAAHQWKPEGDLDVVTRFSAKGRDFASRRKPQAEQKVKEGSFDRAEDPILFSGLRSIRWNMLAPTEYNEVKADYPKNSGVGLVAEAYYLTGDPAYARRAYEMLMAFARSYSEKPRFFLDGLFREDRGLWGTRLHNRYLHLIGYRVLPRLGAYVLDLCWKGLTPEQRLDIEHNVIRTGMFESTIGPVFDDPDFVGKANFEDPPVFIPVADVIGDPAPYRSLDEFFQLMNRMVLKDGVHICSIGTYGVIKSYHSFLRLLDQLGVDVTTDNPGLKNSFHAQPRLVFSIGSTQPMDDGGGGQNALGLNPNFHAASPEIAAWGAELSGNPLVPQIHSFLHALQNEVNQGPTGAERAERLRSFYKNFAAGTAGDENFPVKEIWRPVFVAKEKGIAMLRNRTGGDPMDWIEVLVDYGKYGGRYHGHPSKLGILTAYNGQIGSMDFGDVFRNEKKGRNAWLMGGYVHNTVQVDFSPHRGAGNPIQIGELVGAGENQDVQWIDVQSDRMFPGVSLRRTTFVTPAGIVEFTRCESPTEHTYDWPYHNFGNAVTSLPLSPVDVAGQGLLKFVSNARAGKTDGEIQVVWEDAPIGKKPRKGATSLVGEKVFARLWGLPEKGTELVLFAGPVAATVSEEEEMDFAMLRRKAKSTVFSTVIEPWRESTGPRIRSVEALPVLADGRELSDLEASAVRVTAVDGSSRIFAMNYTKGPVEVAGKILTATGAHWWPTGEP